MVSKTREEMTIAQVAAWLRVLIAPDQVTELRALSVQRGRERPHTVSGFFDYNHLAEMAEKALTISEIAKGVYFTMNPLRSDILARRANRIDYAEEGKLAKDADVVRRRWLLIDADPVRDAHISSADAEKAAALEIVKAIRADLGQQGWPAPILADSGNGYHLLYRVDLPPDDGGVVERCLKALAAKYDTSAVHVDQSVYNAARICKLPGTLARKGDSVRDRPHRRARLLEIPTRNNEPCVPIVAGELLEALAAHAPMPSTPTLAKSSANGTANGFHPSGGDFRHRLLVDRWLQDRGIAFRVKPQANGRGRTVYVLKQCPFDASHGDPDSCIMQAPDGALSAQCFHSSCSGRGWQAFKEAIGKPAPKHYDPPLTNPRQRPKKLASRTSGDHGHSASDGTDGRKSKPTIVLDVDEYRVNDEAITALSNPEAAPEVYQRGNQLVRVLRAAKAGKQGRLDRPEGTPRIAALPSASVSELLTRVADFVKIVETQDGEKRIPAHPPERTIAAVLARGHYPAIRGLEAVIETPTLRPDGTILDTPGWDAETGLLYEPNADFPAIPQTPSRPQAMIAGDNLLDLVSNFPFAGETRNEQDSHRAAWLAGLLTALVRFAIPGSCPLFLFDANCPGTGKTLLTDTIAIVATGRGMSRTAFPDDEAELRKRITSVALAGDRLMLFDNIAQGCPFGGAALDAALTGSTWRDRILGKSEMTAELPLHTVFFATGNNIMLRGDVQRRVIPCRLETKEEKPEERDDFKYPNLLEYVRAHRPQLVCDALTILRAFAVAGSPQAQLAAFGSYEAWSRLIRQVVFWVMEVDPCTTREKMRSADPALNTLAALLEGWLELPGGQTGISVAEALRFLDNPDLKDDFTTLRGALMEWSRNDKLPGAGAIGYKLRSFRQRVLDGRMIDTSTAGHGAGRLWRVVQVQ